MQPRPEKWNASARIISSLLGGLRCCIFKMLGCSTAHLCKWHITFQDHHIILININGHNIRMSFSLQQFEPCPGSDSVLTDLMPDANWLHTNVQYTCAYTANVHGCQYYRMLVSLSVCWFRSSSRESKTRCDWKTTQMQRNHVGPNTINTALYC